MKTVTVKGGEVTLREREDLNVKQRQDLTGTIADVLPVLQSLPFDEDGNLDEEQATKDGLLTKDAIDALFLFTKAAIAVRIESWTLTDKDGNPLAPPRSVDEVDDLKAHVFDEIAPAVSDGLMAMLGEVDFSESNPNAPGFSETPTPPSVA